MIASELAKEPCQRRLPGRAPMSAQDAWMLSTSLPSNWRIVNEDFLKLRSTFTFADFAAALAFLNRVSALAEAADHHPHLTLEWGRVEVTWWTHGAVGLHRNDFIMAARCEEVVRPLSLD